MIFRYLISPYWLSSVGVYVVITLKASLVGFSKVVISTIPLSLRPIWVIVCFILVFFEGTIFLRMVSVGKFARVLRCQLKMISGFV